jgi:hypothetical protein
MFECLSCATAKRCDGSMDFHRSNAADFWSTSTQVSDRSWVSAVHVIAGPGFVNHHEERNAGD